VPEPLTPVTLEGRHVRLEPLELGHAEALAAAAALDRSTFDHTSVPDGIDAMSGYIAGLLDDRDEAKVLPFAQRSTETGQLVGCTRYLDPHWVRGRHDPDEIEVGGTWLCTAAQRTGINTEAKYLLFAYAFETLGVWRLAICTDAENQRSRDAILRIGASFEGVLRNHRLRSNTPEPAARQTAVYSVISEEWPRVKSDLAGRLAAAP
jgi:RimJ/RimL family protein N-acetyltransferase